MAALSGFLPSTCGLPLCLSGITSRIAFSTEMEDHDRRRKVLKKLKHQVLEDIFWPFDLVTGDGITGGDVNMVASDGYGGGEVTGDLTGDLSCLSLTSCTAKAA